MRITVAICTLNHAESLRRTLGSLVGMRVPADLDWELLVVNNSCIDHTDEVIKAFADQLPIRREFEPARGLSRARNRAVDAAKGDYLVWTDDDVIVDPGWLAAYVEAFRRWPEAAVFGGRIIPRYEEPVVKWMSEVESLIGGAHARRDDLGDYGLPLSVAQNRVPYGANFAVRITEQRAFRYNSELGVGPHQHRLAEEIDLIGRIMQSGAFGYWVPTERIDHCIGRERQTTRYRVSGVAIQHDSKCKMATVINTLSSRHLTRRFRVYQHSPIPSRLWGRIAASGVLGMVESVTACAARNGIPASFIRALASSSPTSRGRLSAWWAFYNGQMTKFQLCKARQSVVFRLPGQLSSGHLVATRPKDG